MAKKNKKKLPGNKPVTKAFETPFATNGIQERKFNVIGKKSSTAQLKDKVIAAYFERT